MLGDATIAVVGRTSGEAVAAAAIFPQDGQGPEQEAQGEGLWAEHVCC